MAYEYKLILYIELYNMLYTSYILLTVKFFLVYTNYDRKVKQLLSIPRVAIDRNS